ncbi:hypothetical protein EFO60_09640, partial [Limosilactobacillus reuteri]|nr:hypothetical protein [Limosilactobacillus reuteri]
GSLNMIPDVTPNGVFYLPPTGWLTSFYNPPLFKDSQGKYWVNDCNGLKQISQSKEESLINKLSYKMNLTSN